MVAVCRCVGLSQYSIIILRRVVPYRLSVYDVLLSIVLFVGVVWCRWCLRFEFCMCDIQFLCVLNELNKRRRKQKRALHHRKPFLTNNGHGTILAKKHKVQYHRESRGMKLPSTLQRIAGKKRFFIFPNLPLDIVP